MKKYIVFIKWLFSKKFIRAYKQHNIERKCEHKEWDIDKQIRVIECRGCGKRARVVEYKNLF